MSGIRLVALLVTAVCLSFSAGDAAIVPTEPQQANQPGDKIKSNCLSKTLRRDRGNALSCCQDRDGMYITLGGHDLAFRTFDGKPCTLADGKSTNCEGTGCVYGPCGGKIEWLITADTVHIFQPKSDPKKCGWGAVKVQKCEFSGCKQEWIMGSSPSDPEPFTNQKEYLGAKPTCPFTVCKGGRSH